MKNKNIAILGVTGMLGCAIEKEFQAADFNLIKITREILDAQNCTVVDILNAIKGADYIINCIGIIKPYIHKENSFEVERAIKVNALFPYKLAQAAEILSIRVIQIATDCVYDGSCGKYRENDIHNAVDVYGKTKSLGEVCADNFLNLRCSIIGREKKSYLSLLEWFLNQPKGAKLNGFKNHFWNGVTTNSFAKICKGIIENDTFKPGLQHIVPADILTKAEMLHIFRDVFKRDDIEIQDIDAEIAINRTLVTNNKEENLKLWKNAGYDKIPTIKKMIEEIVW